MLARRKGDQGPGGDLNAVSPAIERVWIDRTDKCDRPSGEDLNDLLFAADCGNMMQLEWAPGWRSESRVVSCRQRGNYRRVGRDGEAVRTYESSHWLYRKSYAGKVGTRVYNSMLRMGGWGGVQACGAGSRGDINAVLSADYGGTEPT
jgi:hypothetical protein